MVVRCSNEAPFVVLEAAAAVRTGIRIEVARGDDPATVIDVLPDTWGRQWRDPLKGPGTGSFSIFADNPHLTANPGILDYGNIVRCYLDEVLRFAFLIEKKAVTVAGEGDDAARVVNVSGRGVLAKLEESVVYLSDGLAGDVERTSAGFLNAGWWMEELLIEALLRGELTAVTRAFTFERDSNGALWEVPLLINERAGTDLLRVAERHAEVAVDAWMSPTLALHYYNERGIDRTLQTDFVAPVILRPGHNIVELSADEDGVIRNVLLIETPAGWLERSDPASVAAYGRRVSYLSLGNVTDGGQVDRVADAIFARNAQPAPDLTLEILDVDDHRPYVSFGVGDWVLAPDLDGNLVKHRVRAINVTEDAEGRPRFPVELATVGDELETRMARWLEAMSRGTMGGVAGEVAEPTKAPSEVQAAALTIVETGVDDHVINDPHPSVLDDLTDVDTTTDPPADDDVLTYDTALNLWVPKPAPGGGGGGVTITRIGKTTIGASELLPVATRIYCKKITLAADSIILAVEAYLRHATATVAGYDVALYSHDATNNRPFRLVGMNTVAWSDRILLDSNGRWVSGPLNQQLAAGTYWLAIHFTDPGDLRFAYELTGGTDGYVGSGSSWTLDPTAVGGSWTQETTDYSFAAVVMAY